MEFLRFSPRNLDDVEAPRAFLEAFEPLLVSAVFEEGEFDATHFVNQSLPLAEGAFEVRFSLDEPLPGALGLEQTHSDILWEAGTFEGNPTGDGLVYAGLESPILSIRTADCLAVALASRVDDTVYAGLVHAGWRGYTAGIHLKALAWLQARAVERGLSEESFLEGLDVFVAPAIFGVSYECGDDVREALAHHRRQRLEPLAGFGDLAPVWEACADVKGGVGGRIHPDFQLLAACDFVAAGLPLERLQVLRENTWGSPVLFSYREACLKGLERGHRMVTHLVMR